MGSRDIRTPGRCSECNTFEKKFVGCAIQNVEVKHVDDDAYEYPYLDSLCSVNEKRDGTLRLKALVGPREFGR
ncbi:uncharacterized protein RSE6_02293 [Rhynchosporium secalis]|uniref:Uncharacterized protein n=1 Tax=Rhynchosporium secalis TaxID=38038 RepID=A0A1E1LZZ3_RHYSE|nr:uncharacterized protein RSE6_02293 [Rhynchosporium secalis]